jgi:hypothetical protein
VIPGFFTYQVSTSIRDFNEVALPGPGFDEVSATVTDLFECKGLLWDKQDCYDYRNQ